MDPMRSTTDHWAACHGARVHGIHCSCRVLAAATGIEPSALDYAYCVAVLQKRWRMTCDHIPQPPRRTVTPMLPPHDSRDPIHLTLIANADLHAD